MFPLICQMLFSMWLLLAVIGHASSCRATLTAPGGSKFILFCNTVLYPVFSIIPSCLALRYAHNIILAAAPWVLYNRGPAEVAFGYFAPHEMRASRRCF
jgi:hypothetical protein